jgi:thymidine kinase
MCTKKATMVIRLDSNGDAQTDGEEITLGGNELYKSVCRKHYRKITKLF